MIEERFLLAKERVEQLAAGEELSGAPFLSCFKEMAGFLKRLLQEEACLRASSWQDFTLCQWQERNRRLYADILPDAYAESYANPAYAAGQLGLDRGRLLAFLYAELHGQIGSVYEGDRESLLIRMELFLEMYQAYACEWQENRAEPAYETLQQIVYWFMHDYVRDEQERRVRAQLDAGQDFALSIIQEADLSDLRYLYRFGEYITENEIRLAQYMNALPEETIRKMADTYTEGYRMGFVAGNKDLSKKKTVNIRYGIGFERMVRKAVENFRVMGLKPVIYRASESAFHKRGVNRIGYFGAAANRQYFYDHREDEALWLDKQYVGRRLDALRAVYEENKELAAVHAGPACIEFFGETPFVPENKPEACVLSGVQQKLAVEYAARSGSIVNEYIPGGERSFTIIAFPVPEIGRRFSEIFDAVIAINTLDSRQYGEMQQRIIDVLDKAAYVWIKGKGENRTDLTVALQSLANPQKESLFENCVADVNIPVGEVFTSPRLRGTNGRLHVSRVFLNGLEYKNLEITFADGHTCGYTCENFDEEEENRRYIRDHVLFHHESLPLGEFAIGTNTTAYRAGQKYGIADKLPILIAEKTGPHFALGDTCYSHSEEVKVYNPDGKELVAKDNECSIRRKEEPLEAYFNCHTDITIPYDELGELSAVLPDGEKVPVIKDGRFALAGCEELNRALDA